MALKSARRPKILANKALNWLRTPQKTLIPELDAHRNSWPWERMPKKDRAAVKDLSRWIREVNFRLKDAEKRMRGSRQIKKNRKVLDWAKASTKEIKSPETFETLLKNGKETADAIWKDKIDGQTSIERACLDYNADADVEKSRKELARLFAHAQKTKKFPFKLHSFEGLYSEFVLFHINERIIEDALSKRKNAIGKMTAQLKGLMKKYGIGPEKS